MYSEHFGLRESPFRISRIPNSFLPGPIAGLRLKHLIHAIPR